MWAKATLGDQIGSRGERQSLQKHAAIKFLLPSVPDLNCAFTSYALTTFSLAELPAKINSSVVLLFKRPYPRFPTYDSHD